MPSDIRYLEVFIVKFRPKRLYFYTWILWDENSSYNIFVVHVYALIQFPAVPDTIWQKYYIVKYWKYYKKKLYKKFFISKINQI